jgi:DNA polymerase-3 subunit beta
MKFRVSSHELLHQLNRASGAISSNPVLPVLEDFLFSVKENTLTITATNLETTIISRLPVTAEEDGALAVPGKIILETLKALPDHPIQFNADEESRAIEITSDFGKYKLAGDNPDDFPEIPATDQDDSIELKAELLHDALQKTLFATSNDELRLAMTGVLFQVDFNKITFVATDAHKLVKYTIGGISTDQTGSLIIPKKPLSLLRSALSSEGNVYLSHNKSNAFFKFDDVDLICRLIDAKYPDYNAVIPADNPNELLVNRQDFQNSLKRIAIYANKTTNQVKLGLSNGSLTISAEDLDFSNEASEQLSCTYKGDPIQIGFNARFLIEMLGVLDSDEIRFEMSTPSRAGVMFPTDEDEGANLLMLVMPVMLGN